MISRYNFLVFLLLMPNTDSQLNVLNTNYIKVQMMYTGMGFCFT